MTPERGEEQRTAGIWFKVCEVCSRPLLRLLCMPYAGGNAQIFRDWSTGLSGDLDLWALQQPGRIPRINEPAFTDCRRLVEAVADALPRPEGVPYVFFGHSMGALVSFELIRELRRRGWKLPQRLVVSGRIAPQYPRFTQPIYNLDEDRFRAAVFAMGGTPRAVIEDSELMDFFARSLRADFTLVDTWRYQHEAPLALPISVFGGYDAPQTHREGLEAWRDETTGETTIHMFEGNHFFLHSREAELLARLAKILRDLR
jgi:surfactin synthase thioesterase subunit